MTQMTGATSSTQRPFFRYDLQTTAIEEGGNRYVDVTAPDGGESFRFYEVEYAVACGMDGERDVESIVRWAKSELDLQTTSDEVAAVVAKLAELNYIEGSEVEAAAVRRQNELPTPVPTGDGLELGTSGKASVEKVTQPRAASVPDLELGVAGSEMVSSATPSIDSEFELGVAGNEGADPVDVVEPAAAAKAALAAKTAADAKAVAEKAAAEAAKAEVAARARVITPAELPAVAAPVMAAVEEATPELIDTSSDISDSIAAEAEPVVDAGTEVIALADSPENDAKREAAVEKVEKRALERASRRPLVRRSASIALWLILLGSVGGFAYYYFFHTKLVLEHPADQRLNLNPPPAAEVPVPQEFAAASTMTVTDVPTAEALASRAGVVEWVSDPGSEVSAGDTILRIRGAARLVAAVDKQTKALETLTKELEVAQSDEDDEALEALKAKVAGKKTELEAAEAKLAPFIATAPIDGVVEVLVKARDRVKANQPVSKVTGSSESIAIFTLSEGNTAAEGEEYVVTSVLDGEGDTRCRVTAVEEQEVTLLCPSDSGIEADAAIVLVAPAAPAAPEAP